MSDSLLTGSELQRFEELHDRWLVFEPMSNYEFATYSNLYTLPVGQDIRPEIIVNSGSVSSISGTITVEKDIHVFFDEIEALQFLNEFGTNISSYSKTEINDDIKGLITRYEIHVINYPEIEIGFDIINGENKLGFVLQPYISGSSEFGEDSSNQILLEKVSKKVLYNTNGDIVTDTYLKYFCLFCSEENANIEDSSTPILSQNDIFLGLAEEDEQ